LVILYYWLCSLILGLFGGFVNLYCIIWVKSSYLSRGHIGCRNTRRPGWCYVSPYDQDRYGYVFALKLKAIKNANNGSEKVNVQLFSRTFKTNPNYYYAFGSPSPDGTKMIFNTEDGGTFVAEAQ